MTDSGVEDQKSSTPNRRGTIAFVSNRPHDAIRKACEALGIVEISDKSSADIVFQDIGWASCFPSPSFPQKFNHFPELYSVVGAKHSLALYFNNVRHKRPDAFDFTPKTWVLPQHMQEWKTYHRTHPSSVFIVKPSNRSEGSGIFLTRSATLTASTLSPMVSQVYIPNPLLMDGYKFDLRLYVLITSIAPLRLYRHTKGLTRISTVPYEKPTQWNFDNQFLHLTNYTLNKANSSIRVVDHKKDLSAFDSLISSSSRQQSVVWDSIDDVIVKTFLAVLPTLQKAYKLKFKCNDSVPVCFQVVGFDIILDAEFKPYVLEVNSLPSFAMEMEIDESVKVPMMCDTLRMICPTAPVIGKLFREQKRQNLGNRIHGRWSPPSVHYEKELAKWELKQIGGYKRIFPSKDESRNMYYAQLEKDVQNVASVETPQKDRLRRQASLQPLRSFPTNSKRVGMIKQASLPCVSSPPLSEGFEPGKISPSAEAIRLREMQKRTHLTQAHRIQDAVRQCPRASRMVAHFVCHAAVEPPRRSGLSSDGSVHPQSKNSTSLRLTTIVQVEVRGLLSSVQRKQKSATTTENEGIRGLSENKKSRKLNVCNVSISRPLKVRSPDEKRRY